MLLGRLRVRQKLVLLVVPLLLLAVAGAVPLVLSRIQAAERSSDSAKLVQRAVRITELVQELQQERLASLGFLSNNVPRDEVVSRSTRVLELARQISTDYSAGDDKLAVQLRQVTLRSGIDGLRPQVLEQRIAGIAVYTGFTSVINGLLDQLRLTDDADLRDTSGRQQLALDSIVRHDEATAAEGAALFIEPGRRITMRVVALVAAGFAVETREETVFKKLADPGSADLYEEVEEGNSSSRLNNYLDGLVTSTATEISATIAGNLAPQVESLTAAGRLVETRVAAQAVADADRSARADRWLAGIVGGIALVLLIGAALLSVLIARSIARPLRRLTAGADEVADVAQLELIRVADTDDPEAAVPQLRPVRVGTSDELGELAQAFNRVQQVATNLVERQLVSRQNVATMFGNVGRRTQNLVGRQLAMIDSLERNEQDPALLDRLYRLDHVSTRLRRNANSLVVLSGATDQQITGEPLSVADTIRSALGEIEGFQRVRLGEVDGAVLAPNVTPDVILLLAELLENGTSFSPPHTEVEVQAQSDDDGVLIRIVDHGLGMTPEQLEAENSRLVSRERLDLAPTDVLGLFVAGRLARRHGISVVLLPTPGTGVTAEVRIPERHVVRAGAPAPAPARVPDPAPEPAAAPAAPAAPATDERGWWDSPTPAPRHAPDGSDPGASDRRAGSSTPDGIGRLRGGVPATSGAADFLDGAEQANAAPPRNGAVAAIGAPAAGRAAARGAAPVNSAEPASAAGTDAGPVVPDGAADELAAVAGTGRGEAEAPEPAPDVPRPRGAAGMVRRVRGAQHPDTGAPPQPAEVEPPSADEARQEIEDFEAGVSRALRETGADGGDGFIVEASAAPWDDLDDPEGTDQTRALVQEFEDGVRRALARLEEFTSRPADPAALFERRATVRGAPGSGPADPPAGPPRRLDAGAGARRARDERAIHLDPRPLERHRPPDAPRGTAPTRRAGPTPPFPPTSAAPTSGLPAESPFARLARQEPASPASGETPFALREPPIAPTPPAPGETPFARREPPIAPTPPAPGETPFARRQPPVAPTPPAPDEPPAAAGEPPASVGPAEPPPSAGDTDIGAAPTDAAEPPEPPESPRVAEPPAALATSSGSADVDTADAVDGDAPPPRAEFRPAMPDGRSTPGTPGHVAPPTEAAGPGQPTPAAPDIPAEGSEGGRSQAGETTGRANGSGPNGRVSNGSDGGKIDPSGHGLVRRVPGAQMPAGALAARPGMSTPAPPDPAEQDAAAARSLVEEFEAGVQRALRDAPGAADTDEDGAR